jgi:hypothetical protein
LDVYTQAITPAKHAAQATVLPLGFSSEAVFWGIRLRPRNLGASKFRDDKK